MCLDPAGCKGAPDVNLLPGRGVDYAHLARVRQVVEGCHVRSCFVWAGGNTPSTNDCLHCRLAMQGLCATDACQGRAVEAKLHATLALRGPA